MCFVFSQVFSITINAQSNERCNYIVPTFFGKMPNDKLSSFVDVCDDKLQYIQRLTHINSIQPKKTKNGNLRLADRTAFSDIFMLAN